MLLGMGKQRSGEKEEDPMSHVGRRHKRGEIQMISRGKPTHLHHRRHHHHQQQEDQNISMVECKYCSHCGKRLERKGRAKLDSRGIWRLHCMLCQSCLARRHHHAIMLHKRGERRRKEEKCLELSTALELLHVCEEQQSILHGSSKVLSKVVECIKSLSRKKNVDSKDREKTHHHGKRKHRHRHKVDAPVLCDHYKHWDDNGEEVEEKDRHHRSSMQQDALPRLHRIHVKDGETEEEASCCMDER
eukprot:TRINITY_DN990_c0_g1_i3.p1 TRINITY_DN990_c0_g1~~TRINITY_DN990_c0_g1_i3.p1  ORF type:complete len:245 (+),score=61.11 TRINITY_DN990_c0_g1_i3:1-735(+)